MRAPLTCYVLAALALSSSGASAFSTYFLKLDGTGCEAFRLEVDHRLGMVAAKESKRSCVTFIGEGPIAHVKDQAKVATIGGVEENNVSTGGIFTINFQYPFVTGGRYIIYETTDGRHVGKVRVGTYTLVR